MKQVWKYQLPDAVEPGVPFEIAMPPGSKPLFFAFQGNAMCLWAEVTVGQVMVPKRFVVMFTGQDMPQDTFLEYVGTCGTGGLVFHLYAMLGKLDS